MRLICTDEGCFGEGQTAGCVGDCCASFYLTEETQLSIMNGREEEDALIRNMLVPLGDNHFTCNHWHDKRCTIYNERPQLCRDFPAKGNPCGAPDCKEPNH